MKNFAQHMLILLLLSIVAPGCSDNKIEDPDNHSRVILKLDDDEVNSGSVSGTVVADIIGDYGTDLYPQEGVVVEIFTLDDIYVTETATDASGQFVVQGLTPGEYQIRIETLAYVPYVSREPVKISAGQITDVGTIELLVPVN